MSYEVSLDGYTSRGSLQGPLFLDVMKGVYGKDLTLEIRLTTNRTTWKNFSLPFASVLLSVKSSS